VFVSDHDPNLKGNVAELKIAAEAARLGIPVLRPMTEHERYDLVFELNSRFFRIQCKWATSDGAVITVRLITNRRGPNGFIRTRYTADEIDAVAAYCAATDACYLLPIETIDGRSQVFLRLTPPKNGQRACLNWATDYELEGAVAQLARASAWHAEGRRFESGQLHSSPHALETIGIDQCRQRLGWYAERASAGDSFLLTRRGKPYARLSPPHEQLDLPAPESAKIVPIDFAKERNA
jgi:antitoxin (DNA-binding transcriptional repressor) of toxin-antitoxin stability system